MGQVIGVTGGIGAGKSTVLQLLEGYGKPVLDSDAVVHQLYAPASPVPALLARRWGRQVLNPDGSADRRQIAARVFSAPAELEWLDRLIHPMVKESIRRRAAELDEPLYCAVPLLFEAGWQDEMACTVAVWCSPRVQERRLRRRGWQAHEIAARRQHQWSMDRKLEQADFGIINNGTSTLLAGQVNRLLAELANKT